MTGAVYGGTLLMVRDDERERREAAARLRVLEERVGVARPQPPPSDLERAIAEARLQALMAALDVADRTHRDGEDGGT